MPNRKVVPSILFVGLLLAALILPALTGNSPDPATKDGAVPA